MKTPLFRLAFEGCKRHYKQWIVLGLTIVLSLGVLMSILTVRTNYLEAVCLNHEETYGSWDFTARQLTPAQVEYFKQHSPFEHIGFSYGEDFLYRSEGTETDGGFELRAIDSEAQRMTHLQCVEGRLPQADDEIAIGGGTTYDRMDDADRYSLMSIEGPGGQMDEFYRKQIGDSITVAELNRDWIADPTKPYSVPGKIYKVVGVFERIGFNYAYITSGALTYYDRNWTGMANEAFATAYLEADDRENVEVYKAQLTSGFPEEEWEQAPVWLMENTDKYNLERNAFHNYGVWLFQNLWLACILQVIACAIGVFLTFYVSLANESKKLRTLSALGISRGQVARVAVYEILLLLVVVMPASVATSLLLTFLIQWVIGLWLSLSVPFSVSLPALLIAGGGTLLASALAAGLAGGIWGHKTAAGKPQPMLKPSKPHPRHQRKKSTDFGGLFHKTFVRVPLVLVLVILFLSAGTLVTVQSENKAHHMELAQEKNSDGYSEQMDFSLSVASKVIRDQDPVGVVIQAERESGIANEAMEAISAQKSVEEIYALTDVLMQLWLPADTALSRSTQQETTLGWLEQERDVFSSVAPLDNQEELLEKYHVILNETGIPQADILYPLSLQGGNDTYMNMLLDQRGKLVEGEVNWEALRAGREVLLVGDAKEELGLGVGNVINLLQFFPQNEQNGYNGQPLGSVRKEVIQVKIAGRIHAPEEYGSFLLAPYEALKNLGIPATWNGASFILKKDANYAKFEKQLQKLTGSNPYATITLSTNTERLEKRLDLARSQRAIRLNGSLMSGFFIQICIALLVAFWLIRTERRKRRLGIFKLFGMTHAQLTKQLYGEAILYCLLAGILSILLTGGYFLLLMGDFSWLTWQNILAFLTPTGGILLYSLITIFGILRMLHGKSATELMQADEG